MPDWQRRLFAPELPEPGAELVLPAESARHALVLRLLPGAKIQLFDGRSGGAEAIVVGVSRERVVCRVGARLQVPLSSPALHVVLGLPKAGKLEGITRMLTELGAASLHLALCERSVPRPADTSSRIARLQRIALQACAQSGQARVPELHAPRPLSEITASIPLGTRRLVFWEEARSPFEECLPFGTNTDVWAVVGPEGGLDASEVEALRAHGFDSIGLGRALLRVETAVPVVAALLLHRLGRLRG